MNEFNQALEAINELNEYLFDKLKLEYAVFNITISGYITSIDFNFNGVEIHIWDSENDDRLFFENDNEYEPFDRFIKRKWKSIIVDLNKIKFK